MRVQSRLVRTMVALALLALQSVPLVVAQGGCPGLQIRNDSASSLDEGALCNAAQPWIDRGLQVYVFATDEDPQTEEEWFALRDEVESAWGIYDPATDEFAKGALAFEATTVTSHPFGQDIAFGDALAVTPLDDDSTIVQAEGRFKNSIAAGDLNAAFVEAMTSSFAVAYPDAAANTGADTGSASSAPATTTATGSGFFGRGLAWLAGLGAVIAGAVFFVPRVVIPAWRARQLRQEKERRLEELARRVGSLLFAAGSLFNEHTVEDSTLWKLFVIYGGDKYPDLARQVRDWTQQSITTLGEAMALHADLDNRTPGKAPDDVDALIRAYEMLYLTLVGSNKQILNMSEEELKTFVDPMAGGLEPPVDEAGLVSQIRTLRGQLAEQPLRMDLTLVDPAEVDADGVFGYANRIKEAIANLARMEQEAPLTLTEARNKREQAASSAALPPDLAPQDAFGAVDAMLAEGAREAEQGRWLVVKQQADQAAALLGELQPLFPRLREAVMEHRTRVEQAQAIAAEGYRLPFLPAALARCDEIVGAMYSQLRAGDVTAVQQSRQNLVDQSTDMLRAATGLVEMRKRNLEQLSRLSAEVARVEQERTGTVQPAWATLQTYPPGNWHSVAGNFDAATATLQGLFDDPASMVDTHSGIERKNSMEHQQFDEAERDLAVAFAALSEAEAQLKAITLLLAEVQRIEATLPTLITATRAAIDKAAARRDRDNSKIDQAVDRQIEEARQTLAQAQRVAQHREFVEVARLLTHAQSLAHSAYASAEEQARTVDTLYRRWEEAKTKTPALVNRAVQELNGLLPAARKQSTATLVAAAQDKLGQAVLADTAVAGAEDQALVVALEQALARYAEAGAAAEQASKQILADKNEYEAALHSAAEAIRQTQSMLSTARTSVNAGDAQGVGRTSLTQAQELLPSLPSPGAGFDTLARALEQALRARQLAETANQQARSRIAEVAQAREAERRRREEEERRRRAALEAEARRRAASMRAASVARSSSFVSSSSRSSSSRSSSFGSSRSSRSSSMGSSRRR